MQFGSVIFACPPPCDECAATSTAEGSTVLLVEDDESIAMAMAEVLHDEDFVVKHAHNGLQALQLLDGGLKPCVILLDLMMPVMNGWDFLEVVKGSPRHRDLPVVIASANADARARKFGCPILPKPVELDSLLDAVSSACEASE